MNVRLSNHSLFGNNMVANDKWSSTAVMEKYFTVVITDKLHRVVLRVKLQSAQKGVVLYTTQ